MDSDHDSGKYDYDGGLCFSSIVSIISIFLLAVGPDGLEGLNRLLAYDNFFIYAMVGVMRRKRVTRNRFTHLCGVLLTLANFNKASVDWLMAKA